MKFISLIVSFACIASMANSAPLVIDADGAAPIAVKRSEDQASPESTLPHEHHSLSMLTAHLVPNAHIQARCFGAVCAYKQLLLAQMRLNYEEAMRNEKYQLAAELLAKIGKNLSDISVIGVAAKGN